MPNLIGTIILTAFTLIAFASNSLLCRKALGGELIDPVSFTTLRLASGAIALAIISRLVTDRDTRQKTRGSWRAGFALFAYAAAFSLAYVTLSAGTGALLLFGSVQIAMFAAALRSGEKVRVMQWAGTIAAVGGLVYLVLPGLAAPDPLGALLMCTAGVAWAVYSVLGRGAPAPTVMTAGNFLRATPMALVVSVAALTTFHLRPAGVALALVSGVFTSGLGYILWYKVLRVLTTSQAAVVQLLGPVLTAFGGVMVLSEEVTLRLVASSALILGGVAMAVLKRVPKRK